MSVIRNTVMKIGIYDECPPKQFRNDWEANSELDKYFGAVYLLLYPCMPIEWWMGESESNPGRKCTLEKTFVDSDSNRSSVLTIIAHTTGGAITVTAQDCACNIEIMEQIIAKYAGISWYISSMTTEVTISN